jgi:hypothetical protein
MRAILLNTAILNDANQGNIIGWVFETEMQK